jgi:hypothetical protein
MLDDRIAESGLDRRVDEESAPAKEDAITGKGRGCHRAGRVLAGLSSIPGREKRGGGSRRGERQVVAFLSTMPRGAEG